MEHCMKEVLMRPKPKDSFTLVVSDSIDIETTVNPPPFVEAKLWIGNGESWNVLFTRQYSRIWVLVMARLSPRAYRMLWTYTFHVYVDTVTIIQNIIMLQGILPVVGAKCKVSFDVPNSQAGVLGFTLGIYGEC